MSYLKTKFYKTKEEFFKAVGERIKEIRLLKNMTIEDISQITKIRKEYLKKIEEGQAKGLRTSHVIMIAQALEIKLFELTKNI